MEHVYFHKPTDKAKRSDPNPATRSAACVRTRRPATQATQATPTPTPPTGWGRSYSRHGIVIGPFEFQAYFLARGGTDGRRAGRERGGGWWVG